MLRVSRLAYGDIAWPVARRSSVYPRIVSHNSLILNTGSLRLFHEEARKTKPAFSDEVFEEPAATALEFILVRSHQRVAVLAEPARPLVPEYIEGLLALDVSERLEHVVHRVFFKVESDFELRELIPAVEEMEAAVLSLSARLSYGAELTHIADLDTARGARLRICTETPRGCLGRIAVPVAEDASLGDDATTVAGSLRQQHFQDRLA